MFEKFSHFPRLMTTPANKSWFRWNSRPFLCGANCRNHIENHRKAKKKRKRVSNTACHICRLDGIFYDVDLHDEVFWNHSWNNWGKTKLVTWGVVCGCARTGSGKFPLLIRFAEIFTFPQFLIAHFPFIFQLPMHEKLLTCDRCPKSYHLHCLDPPLLEFPTSLWVSSVYFSFSLFDYSVVKKCLRLCQFPTKHITSLKFRSIYRICSKLS